MEGDKKGFHEEGEKKFPLPGDKRGEKKFFPLQGDMRGEKNQKFGCSLAREYFSSSGGIA